MDVEQALLLKLSLDLGALRAMASEVTSAMAPAAQAMEGTFKDASGRLHDAVTGKFVSMGKAAQDFGGLSVAAIDKLGGAALQAGAVLKPLSDAIVGLAVSALKMAGDMEQTKVAFTQMLGGADKAKALLFELSDFAAKTPFEFPGLVESSKKLLAFGFAGKEIIPMMRTIGDAVAAIGGGAPAIDRVTTALGQMQAKGKVSAEEMMQIAELGIPAWKLLADAIGKSIPEAMKLAEKGILDAKTAIPAILAGMKAQFDGLMEAQSKTLLGKFSNMKDEMGRILTSLGEALAPFAGVAMQAMEPILEFVKQAVAAFGQLPGPMQAVIVGFGVLAAAAGPVLLAVGGLAAGIVAVSSAASILAGPAVLGAIAAMLPAIAVAAALAGAAFAAWKISDWIKNNKDLSDSLKTLAERFPSVAAGAKTMSTQVMESMARMVGLGGITDVMKLAGDASEKAKKQFRDATDEYKKKAEEFKAAAKAEENAAKAALEANMKAAEAARIAKQAQHEYAQAVKTLAAGIKQDWKGVTDLMVDFPRTLSEAMSKGFNIDSALKQVSERISDLKIKFAEMPKGLGAASEEAAARMKWLIERLEITKERLVVMRAEVVAAKAEMEKLAEQRAFERISEGVNDLNQKLLENKDRIQAIAELTRTAFLDIGKDVREVDNAAKALGITLSSSVAEKARLSEEAFAKLQIAFDKGKISAVDYQRAVVSMLTAQLEAANAAGTATQEQVVHLEAAKNKLDEMTVAIPKHRREVDEWSKQFTEFGRELNKVFDTFAGDIAQSILHWDGFGSAAKRAFEGIVQSFTKNIIEGVIKQAIKGVFDMETSFASLGKSISKMFSGLGGLFGGGGSGSGAGAGAGGSGGGSGGGGLGGGGVVDMVTGIGNLITNIISSFSQARMEKDIGRIEVTTRGVLAEALNLRKDHWDQWGKTYDRMGETFNLGYERLGEVLTAIREMSGGGAGLQQLADAFRESMQIMVNEITLFRETTRQQLQLVTEGVWATYQAVAKPGWQTGLPGGVQGNGSAGGGGTSTAGRTGTTINVAVQSYSNDPYSAGMRAGQGVLAVTGVRL